MTQALTDDQVWSLCMAIGFGGFVVGLALILAAGSVARALHHIARHLNGGN